LRKLAPGGTTHSFGIHVAKMAGMPASLTQRAEALLRLLEKGRDADALARAISDNEGSPPQVQLSIFDAHTETFQAIRTLLGETDLNQLTPLQALVKLQEIKDKLS
jgi:DNA mismatch repair protein MutS